MEKSTKTAVIVKKARGLINNCRVKSLINEYRIWRFPYGDELVKPLASLADAVQ